jgi:hypothetical protein
MRTVLPRWKKGLIAQSINRQAGTDFVLIPLFVASGGRDSERSEVIKILKDQKPLWPRDACNEGMVMWKSLRTWHPIATA